MASVMVRVSLASAAIRCSSEFLCSMRALYTTSLASWAAAADAALVGGGDDDGAGALPPLLFLRYRFCRASLAFSTCCCCSCLCCSSAAASLPSSSAVLEVRSFSSDEPLLALSLSWWDFPFGCFCLGVLFFQGEVGRKPGCLPFFMAERFVHGNGVRCTTYTLAGSQGHVLVKGRWAYLHQNQCTRVRACTSSRWRVVKVDTREQCVRGATRWCCITEMIFRTTRRLFIQGAPFGIQRNWPWGGILQREMSIKSVLYCKVRNAISINVRAVLTNRFQNSFHVQEWVGQRKVLLIILDFKSGM